MFSYYGSKSKIVDYYPPPKFDKIIEPFAGSARYSLKYFDKDITIVDKYEIVFNVWKYLQQASKKDILGLPKMKSGDNVNDYDISEVEKHFIGFLICRGMESPRKNVSSFVGDITDNLKDIAENVYKIKHWNIIHGTYADIENIQATWFIDPPYQFGGEHYVESTKNIDFDELSEWCKTRNGQTIVCENTKADWLPFKPMKQMYGSQYKTTEAIWSNCETNYDCVQSSLVF
jgi:site-specific DNA-adenine methylase